MPGDDLRAIPGLEDNHRRALDRKLGISSPRALAEADRRAIHSALATIRPRPSFKRIEAWQNAARDAIDDAAMAKPAWHTAASFAVIFAQRQIDGGWERRLEAEQTEVEPAAEPRQWPGWDCRPLCDWMLGQLGLTGHQEDAATAETGLAGHEEAAAGETPPAAARARRGRGRLRIDSAAITDAGRELDLVRDGTPVAAPPYDLSPPVNLRLTVSGGRSGQQLCAAVWIRRRADHGWSPHEPVTVAPSGRAEFDLSSVPPGGHDMRLLAWATDPGATLAAITLPTLTFGGGAGQGSRPAAAHAGP